MMNQITTAMPVDKSDYSSVWAVVLAAGMSERMGQQKLLLPWQGKTIIEVVIDHILAAGIDHILVVLGSHSKEIEQVLKINSLTICFNPHFAEGMHTSVICGFQNLPLSASAAMVFLGDQPFIPPAVINQVAQTWKESGKRIVIPVFMGKRGHPTLFDNTLKEEIITMDPGSGLRSIISRFSSEIREVHTNSPEINRDIDTKNDYFNELNLIRNRWKK